MSGSAVNRGGVRFEHLPNVDHVDFQWWARMRNHSCNGATMEAAADALIEEIIPFIDANFRTVADQPHRAMAGLSMGGAYTHGITLAHLDKFSHIGMFSGGSIGPMDSPALADAKAFSQKVKVMFVSYGGKEKGAAAKTNSEALAKLGIKSVYYESPETAHEWQSWRRSLYQLAPLLFRD